MDVRISLKILFLDLVLNEKVLTDRSIYGPRVAEKSSFLPKINIEDGNCFVLGD